MTTPVLTRRQAAVRDAIVHHVRTHGWAPTLREIGDAVGLSSVSSVRHQLDSLVTLGVIERMPNRPAAVRVVQADEAA